MISVAPTVPSLNTLETILELLCEITGLRVALVARVTNEQWSCCAVHDGADLGLQSGDTLELSTTY